MSTSYTLSITNLECYPTLESWQNVVFLVNWNYKAVTTVNTETYETFVSGNTKVDTNNIQSFTPFNELTEELVISWISPSIDFITLQEKCNQQLSKIINPPIVTLSPPWSS